MTRINSGFSEMNFGSLSRDGRFLFFSSPDPTEPVSQLIPSSDLYRFDRLTGVTTNIINNQTTLPPGGLGGFQVATRIPEYNAVSPNGNLIVVSERLTLRDGNANPQRTNNLNLYSSLGKPPAIHRKRKRHRL